MKKIALIAALAAVLLSVSSCGSLRTPTSGANKNSVYYSTFFGISLESLVYGDGLIVQ